MTCDDFRGFAISSILSKVFEHCILDRFSNYFSTNDNQFGFKKNLRCSHAIFMINNIVGRYVRDGSTVNLCAVDLSKAFDRINHHALLLKLIKRHLPTNLLDILDLWLSNSWSCVKWLNCMTLFEFKKNRTWCTVSISLCSVFRWNCWSSSQWHSQLRDSICWWHFIFIAVTLRSTKNVYCMRNRTNIVRHDYKCKKNHVVYALDLGLKLAALISLQ
jgi:Reverse transcriptase (RNA-dependent DNA polymerase)